MDLRLYLRLFRRRWIAILLLTVLGAGAGAAVAWSQPTTYAAKAGMFVSTTSTGSDFGQAYQGTLLAQQRAKSYTTLMTDDHLLRSLIAQLNLPNSVGALKKEISASNPAETAVITITVKDRSAEQAMKIANAYGPVFSDFATALETSTPAPAPGTAPSTHQLSVTTLKPVELLPQRVAPHRTLDIALGVVAGLVVGIGWAVCREITDTRLRDAHDAADAAGVRVLGVLPGGAAAQPDETPLLCGQRRLSAVEAYRRLGVNVRMAGADRTTLALVVTAPSGGEGTAAVAADLAITFAEGGDRVILVDANLGKAGLGGLPGLTPAPGLRDVLAERVPLDSALRTWRRGLPLRVLTSGTTLSASREVLQERGIAALRDELASRADVVIIAGPPVLTNTDAVILARAIGQALVVARTKSTRSHELAESVSYLRAADVTVPGVVLNGAAARRGRKRNRLVQPDQPEEGVPAETSHGFEDAPASTVAG